MNFQFTQIQKKEEASQNATNQPETLNKDYAKIQTALRPYPEAIAAVESLLAELLESSRPNANPKTRNPTA